MIEGLGNRKKGGPVCLDFGDVTGGLYYVRVVDLKRT